MTDFGYMLHHRLEMLDLDGTPYTLSIDGGGHLSILEHHPTTLVTVDQNTLTVVNLSLVKSVEIETL